MSTKVLNYSAAIGGVPTAMTSVKLSDPTGAYGIRRADTLAVLVADDTSFTAVTGATGEYTYSAASVVAGVTYEYYIEIVYAGETYRVYDTFVGEPVASGATPASVYSELKIIFGANATAATDKQTLIQSAEKASADRMWGAGPWPYRHRRLDLVTVAGQAYTTLPSDYERIAQASDWLSESASRIERPVFVAPNAWNVVIAQLRTGLGFNGAYGTGDSGTPRIWTIGNETILGVNTPVVRWYPVPDAVLTFEGFQYWAGFPAWDIASTTAIFPDTTFDSMWLRLAERECADKSLKPVGSGSLIPSRQELGVELQRMVAELCSPMIAPAKRDVYHDSADQSVQMGSGDWPRRNSDGNLVL